MKAPCLEDTSRMNLNILMTRSGRRRKRASGVNLIPKTTVAGALVQEPQSLSGIRELYPQLETAPRSPGHPTGIGSGPIPCAPRKFKRFASLELSALSIRRL